MQFKNACLMISLQLISLTSFAYDYQELENAVRESNVDRVHKIVKKGEMHSSDIDGLICLAKDVVKIREKAIFDRKVRVYVGLGLKIIPVAGMVGPIVGCCLDQRGLGAILGLNALLIGIGFSVAMASESRIQPNVAIKSFAFLGSVAAAIFGCALLERRFWRKERISHDTLEKAYQDAITIKAYLKKCAKNN